MKKERHIHLLSGAGFVQVVRTAFNHRFMISPRYFSRFLRLILTGIVASPFIIIERLRFKNKIRSTVLHPQPVFIIGHWRTGTTYLHQLLAKDRQFHYPTTYQCFAPGFFLGGHFKDLYRKGIPYTRPMDNVKMHVDLPQEDEFAMLALTPYSYYQCLLFPASSRKVFERYVRPGKHLTKKWKGAYRYFLKKVSSTGNGRPLLLKNPVNTFRIKELLELFPDARFIYLERDEQAVLLSTQHLCEKFISLFSFQRYNSSRLPADVKWMYDELAKAYLETRALIPAGALVEVKYTDLVAQPLATVQRIYRELGLQGFAEAKDRFEHYISLQSSFIPNDFTRQPA